MQYVFGYIALFVVMWFFAGWFLRRKMKMSSKPPPRSTTGDQLAKSGWGSAQINGVGCNNCLKLVWFEEGILLRMMPIFGRGFLWLPKEQIRFGELEETKLLWARIKQLPIRTVDHEIVLSNQLADFATKKR